MSVVTVLGQDVRWRATNVLRADLTRHCLRLDMGFHNEMTPGKMIERVDGDVTALSNLMSDYSLRVVGNIVALGIGAWLYGQGAITVGTVYLIYHYTEVLRRPLEQLTDQLEDLQRAAGGLERVAELLQRKSREQVPSTRPAVIPDGALGIVLDGVTFG